MGRNERGGLNGDAREDDDTETVWCFGEGASKNSEAEISAQRDLSARCDRPLSQLDRVFYSSYRPVFSPRLFRDEVSTGLPDGPDGYSRLSGWREGTSFNPAGEGTAARQVSPNDLSSKKLLPPFFCSA